TCTHTSVPAAHQSSSSAPLAAATSRAASSPSAAPASAAASAAAWARARSSARRPSGARARSTTTARATTASTSGTACPRSSTRPVSVIAPPPSPGAPRHGHDRGSTRHGRAAPPPASTPDHGAHPGFLRQMGAVFAPDLRKKPGAADATGPPAWGGPVSSRGAGGSVGVVGGEDRGHRGHRLALSEVHDPHPGGVAALAGDLADRHPDEGAGRVDHEDLVVDRHHERGDHVALLGGELDASHALAATALGVEV